MNLDKMIKEFAAQFGTPEKKIRRWTDNEGRMAIEPIAGFLVKQYEPKKGTWTIGFIEKKDKGRRNLVGPYNIEHLPRIAAALYELEKGC
jgi:hypothetical protein